MLWRIETQPEDPWAVLGTKTHTGTRVLLLVADLDIRVIATDTGELLRHLTLDVTRDYQPRGVKPGPQPR